MNLSHTERLPRRKCGRFICTGRLKCVQTCYVIQIGHACTNALGDFRASSWHFVRADMFARRNAKVGTGEKAYGL